MHILWFKKARNDLFEIYDYLSEESLSLAEQTCDEVKKRIEKLAGLPHIGRPGRVSGTKEFVLNNLPYIIPYRMREGRLEILRVYHTSRRAAKDWE